ncbi:hypothetical protein VTK73DRAFT_972 [Phialemonium thermophilum]|uniref:Uncharacterized protein n=1 Tax=Phialemonium thermophilum TaxID=223376 RepID=A0ABR3VU20_9PEZI
MVIGLLTITAIPTTIGVCEALSAQKKANNAQKEKAKFHITVSIPVGGGRSVECFCVLGAGVLWIDHPEAPVPGHKFSGYYFTYPSDEQHLGLVSTIAEDPPMLNWIYVDKDSHLLRHGGRSATLGHVIGPWGWSDDERHVTLQGRDDHFVAVELKEYGRWALFHDPDGRVRRGEMSLGGGDDDGSTAEGGCPYRWHPVKLYRKMVFGMESRYVKGEKGEGENSK